MNMKNTKQTINMVAVTIIVVAAFFAFAVRGGGASPPALQYRVLQAHDNPQLEMLLNTQSNQGWRLHTYTSSGVVIFVK
jgi:hypothetical protein